MGVEGGSLFGEIIKFIVEEVVIALVKEELNNGTIAKMYPVDVKTWN